MSIISNYDNVVQNPVALAYQIVLWVGLCVVLESICRHRDSSNNESVKVTSGQTTQGRS